MPPRGDSSSANPRLSGLVSRSSQQMAASKTFQRFFVEEPANDLVFDIPQARLAALRYFNFGIGACHIIGAYILFAATKVTNRAPVYTFYNNADGQPTPHEIGRVIVGYLSSTVLAISAVYHVLMATFLRPSYEYGLRRCQNSYRWIHYAASTSLVNITVAMLSGVTDIHLLLVIAVLTLTVMCLGILHERINCQYQGRPAHKRMFAFYFGCLPFLTYWSIISSYFFKSVIVINGPTWLWLIIIIQFFVQALFAVNAYLMTKEVSRFKNYLFGEYMFTLLSITAKSFLAWLNFGGSTPLSGE